MRGIFQLSRVVLSRIDRDLHIRRDWKPAAGPCRGPRYACAKAGYFVQRNEARNLQPNRQTLRGKSARGGGREQAVYIERRSVVGGVAQVLVLQACDPEFSAPLLIIECAEIAAQGG